ncbi:hypothetical protein HU200_003594 [Digitaria exilis]|uniref:Uncharacterized protein n=1 Tax=Digitaria exilis TaxID=1010633 RepID=A0A835KUI7_9POAL|nr:hypothetical protein HU200_003594 [Digitaria exilis]
MGLPKQQSFPPQLPWEQVFLA